MFYQSYREGVCCSTWGYRETMDILLWRGIEIRGRQSRRTGRFFVFAVVVGIERGVVREVCCVWR